VCVYCRCVESVVRAECVECVSDLEEASHGTLMQKHAELELSWAHFHLLREIALGQESLGRLFQV
jgi:hypothetical protein